MTQFISALPLVYLSKSVHSEQSYKYSIFLSTNFNSQQDYSDLPMFARATMENPNSS